MVVVSQNVVLEIRIKRFQLLNRIYTSEEEQNNVHFILKVNAVNLFCMLHMKNVYFNKDSI